MARIREVSDNKLLMDMHGMFYDFPKTFSTANIKGLTPVSTHLSISLIFADGMDRLSFLLTNNTLIINSLAVLVQSLVWPLEDMKAWGRKKGYGGPLEQRQCLKPVNLLIHSCVMF